MAGYIKGITIEFSADVQRLNDGLKATQKIINRTQTELGQIDRALKFNPGNTTLLNQKFDALKRNVGETRAKLNELEKLQAQMKADGIDENSAAYRELEREIIKTKDQLKNAEKAVKDFGSVAKQQALAVANQFKVAGEKISAIGQTMSMKVTAPLVAGFTLSAKYASDLDENMNKLDVAFGRNAQAVKDWATTANNQFGLSMVQATDAASAFGALGKGIGLSESEAAQMSTTLAGLSADLGSYFNVGVDESAKALEGIFTGESEALKKFGVVMTDTNLKQFAEDQGLVYSALTQTEKTQLRYNYVLEKTKDAQGDFSRTSDGTANSIKIFQAALQDLASSFGTELLPIITPIIQKISSLIQKFGELSPTTKKIIVILGLIAAAIGPLLIVFGALASAIGTIIPIAIAVGGAIAAISAPVLAVVAAIAAAIAIGIALYKNWDTIKAKAKAFVNAVKATFNAFKTAVIQTFNKIKTAIVTPFTTAFSKIKGIVSKIKGFFPLRLGKLVSFLLPKISIKSIAKKIGEKLTHAPSFSVGGWTRYAKAMNTPYLFTRPTGILAGEAGDEMIYGRKALMRDIAQASGGGGSIIMNVYGSDGMSVTELANAVERKLIQAQKRRTEAWA